MYEFGIPVGYPCGGPWTLRGVRDYVLKDKCHRINVITPVDDREVRLSVDLEDAFVYWLTLRLSCLSYLQSFDPGERHSVIVVLGEGLLGPPKWEE